MKFFLFHLKLLVAQFFSFQGCLWAAESGSKTPILLHPDNPHYVQRSLIETAGLVLPD